MKYQLTYLCLLSLLLILNNRVFTQTSEFGNPVDYGILELDSIITEASGIAASRKNQNVLWTHNDSGDKNRIFALNTNGKNLGIYYIDKVTNRDWEDIAIGPGPVEGADYIYIADIGDNDLKHDTSSIYRIAEPQIDFNQTPVADTIKGTEIIRFKYPDGKHDAEALMIDPVTKDLYVITKGDSNALIFRASYPQSTSELITLEKVGNLKLDLVTAGDISPKGDEIIIKTYFSVYYWKKELGESFIDLFKRDPVTLPYSIEPQGEAVCWSANADGYFTISEEGPLKIKPHLYFYPRLNANIIKKEKNVIDFKLIQNYPNPFNPATTIEYSVPSTEKVKLIIYNTLGELIQTLVNQVQSAGSYKILWQPKNFPSGIYFYSIETAKIRITKKLVYLR